MRRRGGGPRMRLQGNESIGQFSVHASTPCSYMHHVCTECAGYRAPPLGCMGHVVARTLSLDVACIWSTSLIPIEVLVPRTGNGAHIPSITGEPGRGPHMCACFPGLLGRNGFFFPSWPGCPGPALEDQGGGGGSLWNTEFPSRSGARVAAETARRNSYTPPIRLSRRTGITPRRREHMAASPCVCAPSPPTCFEPTFTQLVCMHGASIHLAAGTQAGEGLSRPTRVLADLASPCWTAVAGKRKADKEARGR